MMMAATTTSSTNVYPCASAHRRSRFQALILLTPTLSIPILRLNCNGGRPEHEAHRGPARARGRATQTDRRRSGRDRVEHHGAQQSCTGRARRVGGPDDDDVDPAVANLTVERGVVAAR